VTAGLATIIIGVVLLVGYKSLFATPTIMRGWGDRYDPVDAMVELLLASLMGAGMFSLMKQDRKEGDGKHRAMRFTPISAGPELVWGVTGLRHTTFRPRLFLKGNPAGNLPGIALVCVVFLSVLFVIQMVGTSWKWPRRGMRVRLVRQSGPVVRRELWDQALVVRLDAGGGVYLNSEKVTWAELPSALKEALGRRAERWVYFEGDDNLRFGAAADAIDIIQSEGGVAVLVTPKSRAAAQ
jgi:biopolymer transport protein ExbD